jgi:hypothetical protein
MDILSILKIIGPLAPVAASIAGGMVAGPAGAAAAGKLTSLIMGQFGLPATATAGQLSDAVATGGEETARAKINAAMEEARAKIEGFVEVEKSANELLAKGLTETNATMRAELGHEHWFFTGWRPFIGWVFGTVALAFGLMLTAATARAAWLSPDPLKTLADAWPIFATYFGVLGAAVGVLIKGRSDEKAAAIANNVAMPNSAPPALPKQLGDGVKVVPVKSPSGVIGKPAGDRS